MASHEPAPERPPTICMVLHGLSVGGAEILAGRLARRTSDRFRCVFACLDELGSQGEGLRKDGFDIEVVGRRPGFDLGCARRLADLWRRHRVDLVHAYQYTPFFYSAVARGVHDCPRILFNEHGRFFPDHRRWKRVLFNRLALRRADRVVTVGEWLRQTVVSNEGIPSDRIDVIYNGISTDSAPNTRDSMRDRLGLAHGEIAVLQVARLDPIKDHATALRAMARVTAKRNDIRLLLAGEGPERTAIEAEVKRLQLGERVQLLGNRTDVADLLEASDIALMTSVSEAIPVTILEAMAAGLPVVATNVGGVGELIESGQNGLLVEKEDDAALADAVLQLSADASRRLRMGRCGQERAHRSFSEDRMQAGYESVYRQMLGR